MEIGNKDVFGVIGTIGGIIIAFLFGKSGIVKRYFDNRISKVERQQLREETEVEKTKKENELLHGIVEELNQKVSHLEKELATTNLKLAVMIAYLEKNNPDGDIFIDELKKIINV